MKSVNIALLAVILLALNTGVSAGTVLYNYGWTVDWDHIDLKAYVDPSSLPPDWTSWKDVLIGVNVLQAYNKDSHEWVKNASLAQLGHLEEYKGWVLIHWYDQLWFPWDNPGAITKMYFDPLKPKQV